MCFKRQQTPAPAPAPAPAPKSALKRSIMEIGEFAEKTIAVGIVCGIPIKMILDIEGMKKDIRIINSQVDKLVLTTASIAEALVKIEKKISRDVE